jgi:hypothetical protein
VILGAFAAWEAYAHFIARNRGSHTLSNRIWAFEARHRWGRLAVWAAWVVLGTHLILQVP